ncbi:MAG: PQQ-dependent sugar dehydrogenase [Ignavibacteriae bacterium]|nr:PQQ-dependent sugar dehydrogenase [Ignavibacteriota bacterium]
MNRNNLYVKLIIVIAITVLVSACSRSQGNRGGVFETRDGVQYKVEVILTDLEIPWSIAFANGEMYFTERPGRFQVLRHKGTKPTLIASIAEVYHIGEGGLMGLAFHPRYPDTALVYFSHTYKDKSGNPKNRVVRFKLKDYQLTDPHIIIDNLPGASNHNGCRIRFGPDEKLYVTTGDASERERAQQMTSLAGKILRVDYDGSIPADNPFPNSSIYSLGHRNGQGIDWHPTSGLLFETEHGPSGFDGPGGGDEVNIIDAGKNYGWPVVHHRESSVGMISPLLEFTPAVAPSGGSFYSGKGIPQFANNFFMATLRGRHILRVVLRKENPRVVASAERMLEDLYGRIRDVVEGPDGHLYFCTSNRDRRATPKADDDKILRIIPAD